MNKKINLFIQWFIAILFWVCAGVFASGTGQGDVMSQVATGTLLLRFEDEPSQADHIGSDEIQPDKINNRANFTKSFQWVAPQLESQVDIKVTGPIVRVVLSQIFTNPAQYWAEGIYVFPLPENAAVDHMRMQIGERIIEGQIKERAAAKKVYEQAKQSGRRASLVEQERPNMFTTSVANIPPGESIKVIIEYQHEAERKGDQYSLRFPMTITPRYTPGMRFPDSAQAAELKTDTQRITPPWGLNHENHNPTEINISIQPGFEIADVESRYHQIDKSQIDPRHWQASLPADQHHANADFVLDWSGRELDIPQVQLFAERYKGSEYCLLMISPPIDTEDVQRMPRDITYVIDTSGSMGGESIRQARQALMWAVERLAAQDRFNIIEFNSGAWALFDDVKTADESSKAKALGFIKGLQARGGTEMQRALDLALCESCQSPERLRQVVFLTDGAVGNEEQLFATINDKLGNTRLFTVGIGSAPDSYFMRRAAEIGRGTFTYIGKLEEVNEKMQALFASIEAPVLTNLRLELPDDDHGTSYEVTPSPIPDLYAGSPLVLAIKSKHLPKQITLSGSLNGRIWQTDLDVPDYQFLEKSLVEKSLSGTEIKNGSNTQSGIHVQWARKRIASLLTQRSLSRDMKVKDQLKGDVLKLALQHHLVSPFTSLVAVDTTPVKPQSQKTLSHKLKTNAPKGTTFGLPKTATPWRLYNCLGLLCLILAALTTLFQHRMKLGSASIRI
ncbi:MAG: marine proteobacterial sortase target protein [Porticoccaceae bacterium]|nr:marine proteobacterial sortase target protein [Porticoccaceae bacterium]